MLYLKQSTASQSVLIGPFVDDTDGATAETGLTIANTDIRLSKNGGNLAAKNSGGGTHDEAGWYTITLDATDTNTVGRLQLHVKVSGALMVHHEFQVLEETVYDALFASSAAGEFAVKLSTQGKADVNAEADTALTDYDAVVPGDLPTNFADLSITATTGRVDVASIEGSDATDQINAAADAAIETYGLDHLVSASVAGTDVADDSIVAQMVSKSATADWDDFDNTTDSLQGQRDHIGDGTNLTEAGGDGDHLTAINLPDQTMNITGNITGNLSGSIGSLGATAKSDVNGEVVDALNTDTYGEPGQEAPGATVSLAKKIGYLYKAWRNKSDQDASTYQLYADDASTVDQKATVSDDGSTATKGEVGTGP